MKTDENKLTYKFMGLNLTKEMYEWLVSEGERRCLNISTVVRQMLWEKMKEEKMSGENK